MLQAGTNPKNLIWKSSLDQNQKYIQISSYILKTVTEGINDIRNPSSINEQDFGFKLQTALKL